MSKIPDFNLYNGGSVMLLTPITPAAQEWVDENLPKDPMKLGNAIAVEARYIGDIVMGFTAEGLTLA